jgi:gluconate kinase
MPAALLDSQLATLEMGAPSDWLIVIDDDRPPEAAAAAVAAAWAAQRIRASPLMAE